MAAQIKRTINYKGFDPADTSTTLNQLDENVETQDVDWVDNVSKLVLPASSGAIDIYPPFANGKVQAMIVATYLSGGSGELNMVVDGAAAATKMGDVGSVQASTSLTLENTDAVNAVTVDIFYYIAT